MLPKAVRDLTQELTRLPGIGPKTAQRLSLFLLRQPAAAIAKLASTLTTLHANVHTCQQCFHLAEKDLCEICANTDRNQQLLCVVADSLDLEAIERTATFNGTYHVLGGVLSPLEGIGPDQLTFDELFARVAANHVHEVVLALDHTMESDATARALTQRLKDQGITVTRLARGLPTGGDIEFADNQTLTSAFQGRHTL